MKIAILHHLHTDPEKAPYLLKHCCQHWIQQGHSVINLKGVDGPLPAADLLIMHVNLTVVPQEYVRAAERYSVVINRNVIDISKPAFSQIIVKHDDHYQGPVIIKTRNNYGGLPERQINNLNGKRGLDNMAQKLWQKYEWLRPWCKAEWLTNYPIFESVQKVPPGIWRNEHLVVEKYLPERDRDGYYRVREWIFLGDREIHFINISPEPVVRGINAYRREYLTTDEVPTELRTIRSKLGFDYGKFDYAIYNSMPVLYDINKTIGVARNLRERPEAMEHIERLSQGLEYYLHSRSI